MLESTQIISDVEQEFEGGSSLSIDWDSILTRAVKGILKRTKPRTLKRIASIYGGFSNDLYLYYCPSDLLATSGIYDNSAIADLNNRKPAFNYLPPKAFYNQSEDNTFTIDNINGVRYIMSRKSLNTSILVIEEFETTTGKTGATPTLNTYNALFTKAIKGTFTTIDNAMSWDLDESLDISDYINDGILSLPIFINDKSKISDLEIRLKTTNSDYYSLKLSLDSNVEDNLINGWNFLRFILENKSTTGSPDYTDIAKVSIVLTPTTGETVVATFDKMSLMLPTRFNIEYFSNNPYISGSTNEYWQSSFSYGNEDKINFDESLEAVLHYEMALLVYTSATFERVDPQLKKTFLENLQREWNDYYSDNPSDELLLSYNISPEIDMFIEY